MGQTGDPPERQKDADLVLRPTSELLNALGAREGGASWGMRRAGRERREGRLFARIEYGVSC